MRIEENKGNRAVVYARYSSHNQREESIEGQLRECHTYAEREGLTIINEYIDRGISAKTDNRPSFQQMIKDAESKTFNYIIVYTLDRFARNRYDSAMYKAKLKKCGVRIISATQAISTDPEGIILEAVLEGMAEYYSENLARGVRRGMRENATKCMVNGKAPYGYKRGADGRFEVDHIRAEVVRQVFKLYSEGFLMSEIARKINEQGHKTSAGHPFNNSRISGMLSNKAYIGVYKYDDIEIEGGMPRIVDDDLFNRVQFLRKSNSRPRTKSRQKVDFLLSTKLYCGECGSAMTGDSGTSNAGVTHYYYTCYNHRRHNGCTMKSVRKEWLEDIVIEKTMEKLIDEIIDQIATKVEEITKKESQNEPRLKELKQALREVNKKLLNIQDAIESGMFEGITNERIAALREEKAYYESEIREELKAKPIIRKDDVVLWLSQFKNGDKDSPTFRRNLVDILVSKVIVYNLNPDDRTRKITILFNLSEEFEEDVVEFEKNSRRRVMKIRDVNDWCTS